MSITVQNVSKYYGSQKALNNISFRVDTGEVVGFLGPNGAGKTTTMKIITTYLAASEGDVTVSGLPVEENRKAVRAKIGYLPENNPLYTDMQVIDYLRFAASVNGVKKEETDNRIKEMVVLCGLDSEKHKYISELSKGYRQRVGLAQAMIHDPEILILDEPTTGLDPNQIVEIRNLIRKMGEKKTVLLSTHILSEVEATCDRILIINKGEIVADGTAADLRKMSSAGDILHLRIGGADDPEKVLNALSAQQNFLTEKTGDSGFEFIITPDDIQEAKKLIFSICAENGWYIDSLTAKETKLEDIFRELTN